jgi:hypothetical protein
MRFTKRYTYLFANAVTFCARLSPDGEVRLEVLT